MRFRQLECYFHVCAHGSITQAANALNIAQTALGIQIRQLEDEMGVSLLMRTSRGVQPTEAGKLFLDWVRRTLDSRHEIKRNLAAFRGDDTPQIVTVGLTPSLTLLLGADLIEAVGRSPIKINLQLTEGLSHVIVAGMASGKADIIFAFKPDASATLRCTPLLRESLYLIRRPEHPDSRTKTVALHEALGNRFAMPDRGDVVRRMIEERAATEALALDVAYEVHSITAIKQLVARGLALAILPLGCVHDEVVAGQLSASRILDAALDRTLYAIRPTDLDPAIDTLLISTFLSVYREIARAWGMGEVLMLA
ncbi:LysR family transcriptional regulator [Ancylobacter polymorphus]|uniref:LysR family nitrogen assimilation transcriptional regulator n=1 Tax=Ancylobacter polymorphus TaxID=223390 RepID=A0ABU0BG94_9HYPH|nr:LysR family transcriptional regulator [Ancylobacter polymorphus]MDQ0304857.1 LysR family nitrogen assimilation transcriptional regulator [Ancylobacter polymorphus]